MSRRPTPRLPVYAALAGVTLLLGVVARRPEFAVLGLPFAVILVCGLATLEPVDVEVALGWSEAVLVAGDEVVLTVTVSCLTRVPRADVEIRVPPELVVVDGPPSFTLSGSAGAVVEERVRLRAARWGAPTVRVALRTFDPFRLYATRGELAGVPPLRVHPTTEHLRAIARPQRLLALAGSHLSRTRGEGVEYADARPFVPGDRMRMVNWRVSARRDELWVGERHPDRNGDVVLFVDLFSEVGDELDSTLDMAVRAATALTEGHLGANDRVGLVGLGGLLRWLPPGMGDRQLHAVADALLDSEVVATHAPKGIDVIPVRGLPPRAFVVAVSPLLDPRAIALFLELRGRGFDLAIVECSPEPFAARPDRANAVVARRLWELDRAAMRERLVATGAVLVSWDRGQPLAEVLEGIRRWRRAPRMALR